MSEDKWVVYYDHNDGSNMRLPFDSEDEANKWLAYHRNAENLLFNMELRRVTNLRMRERPGDPINTTPTQTERALHGQLGTAQSGTAAAQSNACPHCGLIHETTCWRIKSLEYYPDGKIKRVELHERRHLPFQLPSLDNHGNID